MNTLIAVLYVAVGVVNLLPVVGVLSTSRLQTLYGVSLVDPNLVILMRHRAVLFGVVGGLLVAAAFHPTLRPIAAAGGLISMLSFVLLAYVIGEFNTELRRVVAADLVASFLLVAAVLLTLWSSSREAAAS
jgi:hypothetical protein